jgi:CheY-like chemotaxis protein
MSADTAPGPPVGLLLSDDLIFTSRVSGTARALGVAVQPARSSQALEEAARRQTPRCVLVDLGNPGLVIADLIRRLQECCMPMPKVVAYGSHVDTATLKQAREAGCDIVWPRSKFVEELPQALPAWFGKPASEESRVP